MKKNATILLELHYLPCVQYFSKLVQYDQVLIEQHEHYTKGSYRNRTYLAAANGPLALSVPLLKGKNQQQSIRAVEISNSMVWQSEHWTSIRSAYGSAPYFEHYAPELRQFYKSKYSSLFDWNQALFDWILRKLKIKTPIELTSQYLHEAGPDIDDWRNAIHPKAHRRRTDPQFKAQYYAQVFEEKHGFLPNLSILDLLFCCGPQAVLVLEDCITD